MVCQKCGRNEANVFYTQNINGRKSEVHLCSECAEELNIFGNFDYSNNFDFGFDRIFSNFFDGFGGLGLANLPKILISDGNGFQSENYYDNTNTDLDDALKKITKKNNCLTEQEKLEKELKKCIESENYERAAIIRDELKKYKND